MTLVKPTRGFDLVAFNVIWGVIWCICLSYCFCKCYQADRQGPGASCCCTNIPVCNTPIEWHILSRRLFRKTVLGFVVCKCFNLLIVYSTTPLLTSLLYIRSFSWFLENNTSWMFWHIYLMWLYQMTLLSPAHLISSPLRSGFGVMLFSTTGYRVAITSPRWFSGKFWLGFCSE